MIDSKGLGREPVELPHLKLHHCPPQVDLISMMQTRAAHVAMYLLAEALADNPKAAFPPGLYQRSL